MSSESGGVKENRNLLTLTSWRPFESSLISRKSNKVSAEILRDNEHPYSKSLNSVTFNLYSNVSSNVHNIEAQNATCDQNEPEFTELSICNEENVIESWPTAGFDESQIREILQSLDSQLAPFINDEEFSINVSTVEEKSKDKQGLKSKLSHKANHSTGAEFESENSVESYNSFEPLPYPCSFCGVKLKSFVEYFKHRKNHVKEKPFKCGQGNCKESFNSEENLELHVAAIHQLGEKCNQAGAKERNVPNSNQVLNCPKCEKSFNRVSKLRSHMVIHAKEEDFKCDICDLNFEFLAEYEQHEYDHLHGQKLIKVEPGLKFQCRLCEKFFLSKPSLEYHVRSGRCKHPAIKDYKPKFSRRKRDPDLPEVPLELSENELRLGRKRTGGNFPCEVCGKVFNRADHMRRHLVVHTKEKMFTCKTCGKNFTQKSSLSTHEKIHIASTGQSAKGSNVNIDDVMITCKLCDRKFIQKTNYNNHLKNCHREIFGEDDSESLSCYFCKCTFNTKLGLSAHITRHHPEHARVKNRIPFVYDPIKENGTVSIKGDSYRAMPLKQAAAVSQTTNSFRKQMFGPTVFNSGKFSISPELFSQSNGRSVYVMDSYKADDEPKRVKPFNKTKSASKTEQAIEMEEVAIPTRRRHDANDSLANLDIHLRRLGPEGKFEARVCHFCGKEFTRACDLVRHIRKHTKEKPFSCPECNKNFTNRFNRDQHLIKHDQNFVEKLLSKCEFCGKILANSQTLSAHMRTVHSGLKPYQCEFCKKHFPTKGQMESHKKMHEKKFTTLESKTSNNENEKNNDEASSLNVELKEPLLITSAGVFKTLSAKSDHEFNQFEKSKSGYNFQCTKCDRKFRRNVDCQRHIASHNDTNLKPFKCTLCHDRFKTNVTLKHHLLKHFRNDKKFSCDECTKKYSVKANLKWHKAVAHSITKPFMCPYCGKSFKLMSLCKTHIKTHRKALQQNNEVKKVPIAEIDKSIIPEPVEDAIAVGDADSSLKIIPKPTSKKYGSEVEILDAGEFLKERSKTRRKSPLISEIPANSEAGITVWLKSAAEIGSETGPIQVKLRTESSDKTPGFVNTSEEACSSRSDYNVSSDDGVTDTIFGGSSFNRSDLKSSSAFHKARIEKSPTLQQSVHVQNVLNNSSLEPSENEAIGVGFHFCEDKEVSKDGTVRAPNILKRRNKNSPKKRQSKPIDLSSRLILAEAPVIKDNSVIPMEDQGANGGNQPSIVNVDQNDSNTDQLDISSEFPNRTKRPNQISSAMFSPIKGTKVSGDTAAGMAEVSAFKDVPENRDDFSAKFACPKCSKSYPTALQLKAHRIITHGSSDVVDLTVKKEISTDKMKSCQPEESILALRNDKTWTMEDRNSRKFIKRDISSYEQIRTSLKNFKTKCSVCLVSFTNFARLQAHFQSYHVVKPQCLSGSLNVSGPPPKFSDPEFIRISRRDASDIKHKMSQTAKEDRLNVTVSEKILLRSIDDIDREMRKDISSGNYDQQIRMKNNKSNQCQDCPKAFSSVSALTQHRRSHTDERPFVCAICDKGYKTKSSYTYHVTGHFRTRKLYKCHLCKRQFVTASSLSLHMRLHSGAAPLQCRFCTKRFPSSYSRQYHMDQVHFTSRMHARRQKQAELRKKYKRKQADPKKKDTVSDIQRSASESEKPVLLQEPNLGTQPVGEETQAYPQIVDQPQSEILTVATSTSIQTGVYETTAASNSISDFPVESQFISYTSENTFESNNMNVQYIAIPFDDLSFPVDSIMDESGSYNWLTIPSANCDTQLEHQNIFYDDTGGSIGFIQPNVQIQDQNLQIASSHSDRFVYADSNTGNEFFPVNLPLSQRFFSTEDNFAYVENSNLGPRPDQF